MQPPGRQSVNALTIDVEDWFHILEVGGPPLREWAGLPSRVEACTDRLLELFRKHGVKATFFVLGWIAEHHPTLVRRIVDAGHEVATHGYGHLLVHQVSPREFRDDLRRSTRLLEDLSGRRVVGHRATGFSITRASLWAFDILKEEGLVYDASVCPAPHGHGGLPGYPLHPYRQPAGERGTIWEFPVSCLQIGPWRLPFSGGGYLRLFPYPLIARQIRRLNRRGHPAIVYVHPREVDPFHPRLPMPLLRRFKSYVNLGTTLSKLDRLLTEFRFKPLAELEPSIKSGT